MVGLFTRLMIIIFMVCTVLIAIIPQVFAHSVIDDMEIRERLGFNVCELPCFAGIEIGKTTQYEATQLVEANISVVDGVIQGSSSIRFATRIGQHQLYSGIFFDGDIATEIIISSLNNRAIFEQLGTPACVLLAPDRSLNYINFIWQRGDYVYMVEFSGSALVRILNPTEVFSQIIIFQASDYCNNPDDRHVAMVWRGFAPQDYYERWQDE